MCQIQGEICTMRFNFTGTAAGLAALTLAAPTTLVRRSGNNTDVGVLQFALTLEHLENAFYKQAVSTWTLEDFVAANFSESFFSQVKYITHDEERHVIFLEDALRAAGAEPVPACSYQFNLSGPQDFIAKAAIIEGVGASAYAGAAPLIGFKQYLTAAASILVTESLHQSALRSAVGEVPMANPFGTPLGVRAVYSAASQFIVSCPDAAKLNVQSYPVLTLTQGLPLAPNESATFNVAAGGPTLPSTACVTFYSGLDMVPVAASVSGKQITCVVPSQASGQSYVFISSDRSSNLTDANILYGPAIVEVTPGSPTFNVSVT
ncbi:LAMI_0B08570g1_1 [Lachancea mirantina]|uniref:LAMI_0B08570g1_1 n=1 Tax=Lachancea mirantina TaxID=1230905 RepID=A0A1G4IY35_9SACH|nr:LAMI_0B08570g1_1 [Lachancea mirantina]